MDAVNIDQYLDTVAQLKQQGLDPSQISLNLREQQIPEEVVSVVMQEWNKRVTSKKRNNGFIYCGIGTSLLVISFLVSVLLFYADKNITWALYGCTFVGLCLTFKGMISLFGW